MLTLRSLKSEGLLQKKIKVMSSDKKNKPEAGSEYNVDARGSLGLLALGDVGILAWREAKEKEKAKEDNDNKKKEE